MKAGKFKQEQAFSLFPIPLGFWTISHLTDCNNMDKLDILCHDSWQNLLITWLCFVQVLYDLSFNSLHPQAGRSLIY